MALRKYRLGSLIEQRREKNPGLDCVVKGVTREGFIDPKVPDADTHLYNVFYRNDFVFNPARMELNSIALNTDYEVGICSSLYEVFYVSRPDILDPRYLRLYIKRDEFARLCGYIGWGSAREYCRVGGIAEIELELPPIEIQRKYVAVYEAMLENQRSYERGLDDLKLTCDGWFDRIKGKARLVRVGDLVTEVDVRNDAARYSEVRGISSDHVFIESRASLKDEQKYKVVSPGQIACNLIHVGRDGVYPIAKNDSGHAILVSPDYAVLAPKSAHIGSYLMGWFSRDEAGRYGWYVCAEDVRGRMNLSKFMNLELPIPEEKVLRSVAELREVYRQRSEINERLKAQLKDICPILIKGSIDEARAG